MTLRDLIVTKAWAYTIGVPIEKVDGKDKLEYTSFSEYFLALIKVASNIAIGLAVLMIVWGAFKYVTSGGDETKAREGKDVIIGALVGLALLFLIKLIIPIIGVRE
ncbi:hypothetical protein HY844_02215 [Candidatus Berkelbacteria bacterium]|nr:hypothetical protein [Candidatus Berkelbacteria bacterium]